jgi:uncharacterized membrane protein YhaH (DUF805 family)
MLGACIRRTRRPSPGEAGSASEPRSFARCTDEEWFSRVGAVLYVPWLVPFVSVGIRRLHDVGRSGWWCFGMLSCIGWLVLLGFWSERGKPGENRFGPPPW